MLKQDIAQDLKSAMKSGDTVTRDTLRMLESMITNEEIAQAKREDGLDDAGVVALVKRAIKQRRDSAAQYRAGGREESAAAEEAESTVLEKYLPAQMDDAALREIIARVVAATGATSKADMGKVMGAVMQEVGDASDGNAVRAVVDELLH